MFERVVPLVLVLPFRSSTLSLTQHTDGVVAVHRGAGQVRTVGGRGVNGLVRRERRFLRRTVSNQMYREMNPPEALASSRQSMVPAALMISQALSPRVPEVTVNRAASVGAANRQHERLSPRDMSPGSSRPVWSASWTCRPGTSRSSIRRARSPWPAPWRCRCCCSGGDHRAAGGAAADSVTVPVGWFCPSTLAGAMASESSAARHAGVGVRRGSWRRCGGRSGRRGGRRLSSPGSSPQPATRNQHSCTSTARNRHPLILPSPSLKRPEPGLRDRDCITGVVDFEAGPVDYPVNGRIHRQRDGGTPCATCA